MVAIFAVVKEMTRVSPTSFLQTIRSSSMRPKRTNFFIIVGFFFGLKINLDKSELIPVGKWLT